MFKKIHDQIQNLATIEEDTILSESVFKYFSAKPFNQTYKKEQSLIYFISLQLYASATKYLMDDLEARSKTFSINEEIEIRFSVDAIKVYIPFKEITEEICYQIKQEKCYLTILSTLGRQLIEQIILVKEVKSQNISDDKIFVASVAAYNKHVGANNIDLLNDMNEDNVGLFKCFKQRMRPENLSKSYKLRRLYNFFSGDIHSPSIISKFILNGTMEESKFDYYTEVYYRQFIGFLVYCLEFMLDYHGKSNSDDDILAEIKETSKDFSYSFLDDN